MPALGVETFYGVRKGDVSQCRRLPHFRGERRRRQRNVLVVFLIFLRL